VRYLSVCSGIESATVAWHGLGWQPVGFSEIEPFPSAVLAHHYPTVPNYGDMTKHETWPITPGTVDLLVGGTPCQSFSVAGLRQGMADPRGNLALVYLALVARIKPRWVVWENVPGVLSDRSGAFGAFLGGLGQLGYGWAYRVLDAQHFGVPQRRRRVFVVGCAGGCWQRAAAVLFEPESLRGDTPPGRAARESVAPTISARTKGGGGLGTDFDLDGGLIASTVTSKWAKGSGGPSGDECQNLVPTAYGFQPRIARNGRGDMGDTCDTLSAQAGGTGKGDSAPCVAFGPLRYGGSNQDTMHSAGGVLNTLPGGTHDNGGHFTKTLVGMQVRRLTPRECERLQGFPDDYTLAPYRGKPACDGPRYKALGNSMAVPCMRWIGERLAAVDKIPAQPLHSSAI
jgi:DNA (cytosine-5)-methyltransferase 1